MNRILYENRCSCKEKEKLFITKKRKSSYWRERIPIGYPKEKEITLKTFQIKYPHQLSLTARFLLNSFQNKYLFYAMDDILSTFQSSSMERNNLLAILYSPVLSLQNNFSIDFFDIWIRQVHIEEIPKTNRFLNEEDPLLNQFTYITIQFFYQIKLPPKKREALW